LKRHFKKMIAPTIAILIVVAYFAFLGGMLVFGDGIPVPIRILGLIIPAAFVGVGVFVLAERVNEIKRGEEDDLSKY